MDKSLSRGWFGCGYFGGGFCILELVSAEVKLARALSFQRMITLLNEYWASHGCVLVQPYDMPVGAGTFHPATILRALGPEPWRSAYVQPCRRPTDGRYGRSSYRLQHYFQYQVLLKPSPHDSRWLYLDSLRTIGLKPDEHEFYFECDDWESPALGAWGSGWEVRCNGMEVSQFTYFQQVCGIDCRPVSTELTYGLERLAMLIQGKKSVFDLTWSRNEEDGSEVSYGDMFARSEREQSAYNLEHSEIGELHHRFDFAVRKSTELAERGLAVPAYEFCLEASHHFNLLDARHVFSNVERQANILTVRYLAQRAGEAWLAQREATTSASQEIVPQEEAEQEEFA